MPPSDKKIKIPVIVPTMHQQSGKTAKDIRQEHLDQLMKSFEQGFPNFNRAIETLRRDNKTSPSD